MAYAPAADTALFTRRGAVFLAIIGIHVGMIFLLYSGMSRRLVDAVLGPIETRIIEEAPKDEEKPPPPPPKLDIPPPPFVPPPDVSIDIPVQESSTAIQTLTTVIPPKAPPVTAPAPVERVVAAPKSDPRRPLSQPEYPPSSRRAGEAGTVKLDVYVLENGRVGDARVKESSGFPKLDEAALREVKRAWRLLPGTENGKAVAMWGQFAVTFKLTD